MTLLTVAFVIEYVIDLHTILTITFAATLPGHSSRQGSNETNDTR